MRPIVRPEPKKRHPSLASRALLLTDADHAGHAAAAQAAPQSPCRSRSFDRHPVGNGPAADLHLRDRDDLGPGRSGTEPDAGRLVQPQPHRSWLSLLLGTQLAMAQGERRTALPGRVDRRSCVGDCRKHPDDHRSLSGSDHRAGLFGRFHPQFGQRHCDDGIGFPRRAAPAGLGQHRRSCCCSSLSRSSPSATI